MCAPRDERSRASPAVDPARAITPHVVRNSRLGQRGHNARAGSGRVDRRQRWVARTANAGQVVDQVARQQRGVDLFFFFLFFWCRATGWQTQLR